MISLGEALANERKRKQITLHHISQKTNIGVKSLEALENNQFTRISGFYLKNYIKSYLKAIECEEHDFWDRHKELLGTAFDDSSDRTKAYYSKLRYSRFKEKNVIFSLFIFGIVVLITFAFLYYSKDTLSSPGGAYDPKAPSPFIHTIHPHLFASADYDFNIDYWPIQVSVEFLADCWMQVNRGNKKVTERVFRKGEKGSWKGYELRFYINNPSVVKFIVNGRELSYLKKIFQMERLIITPTTLNQVY